MPLDCKQLLKRFFSKNRPPPPTKWKKPCRNKTSETLEIMRKVSNFGVYIFVLFMLVFLHLDSFRLHLTKLKSVLSGNLEAILKCGPLWGRFFSSVPYFCLKTSNSLPVCHWCEIINKLLAPIICTNCAFYNKGKISKRKVTEGWTARASNMPPLFLPLPLLQYMTQAGYF